MSAPLVELLERMGTQRVYVIGDRMIDRYSFGSVPRISPEAPVPVFIEDKREDRPGGCGNVAQQLRALQINVLECHGPVPSLKHRFFVGSHPVFRIDLDCPPHRPSRSEINHVLETLPDCDAVVLSDYAKGWVSESLAADLISCARKHGIPVVVDPKGTQWTKYSGCSVICPNQPEVDAVGLGWARHAFQAVLVKRGAEGLSLWDHFHDSSLDVPARARHVFDVTGAGDTVVALVAATLAVDGTLEQAATLAAIAAGYVVGEVGTAVCPGNVLKHLVEREHVYFPSQKDHPQPAGD